MVLKVTSHCIVQSVHALSVSTDFQALFFFFSHFLHWLSEDDSGDNNDRIVRKGNYCCAAALRSHVSELTGNLRWPVTGGIRQVSTSSNVLKECRGKEKEKTLKDHYLMTGTDTDPLWEKNGFLKGSSCVLLFNLKPSLKGTPSGVGFYVKKITGFNL